MSAWKEVVQQWERCRTGLSGELGALDPQYLDVRPAGGARSAREIALHVRQSSFNFLERYDPGGPGPGELAPAAPADDLAAALMDDWTGTIRGRLARLEEQADTVMDSPFGRQTLLSHTWFTLSHEWYHRGQMATYVRLSGRIPALTQFIEQRKNRG